MIKPLKDWHITTKYGYRIHPITNEYKFHNGIDLRAEIGTPIYSPDSGYVEFTGNYPAGGNEIYIQHDNNYRTTYSHLNSFSKNSGDRVIKGELIGYTGNSGNSTAPHLHFGVKFNGVRIDPETIEWEDPYNIIGKYNFNKGIIPKVAIIGGSIIFILILLLKRKNG